MAVAGHGCSSQVEARDHGEETRARSPRRPEQIGIRVLVGVQLLAVGGHHVDRGDARAGRAEDARQPAEPALQQVSAERDALAVPDREEEVVRAQGAGQVRAAHSRLHDGGAGLGVDRHLRQPREVEQHPAVAQVRAAPAVAAGAHADLHVLLAREPQRAHHVLLAGGLDDQIGEAIGDAAVPDAVAPRRLIARVAAPQDSSVRH